MNQNFTPGRYVRSRGEAEQHLAHKHPDIAEIRKAMRRTLTNERPAAMLLIELTRRGYVMTWAKALEAVDRVKVARLAPVKGDGEMIARATADIVLTFDATWITPEPDREQQATIWSAIAQDDERGDDWSDFEYTRLRERLMRTDRWWGMLNRAMRDKLERGECVDLARCGRTVSGWYIIPADVFQESVDYCDGDVEAWIWSVAREEGTGIIYASQGSDLYQRTGYNCLWLR